MPSPLPLPYLVLDQNALRKPALLEPAIACARTNDMQLLLIDALFVEMWKSPQWEMTTRRSFALLSRCTELIMLGRGLPELIRLEQATGSPALALVADVERTPSLRECLAELAADPKSTPALFERLHTDIATMQTDIIDPQYLDHERNKQQVVAYRDVLAANTSQEERRAARDNPEEQASWLADPAWETVVADGLRKRGVASADAERLAHGPSVIANNWLASGSLAIRWLVDSGLDPAKPATITNDVMDGEYITIGSLCVDLVSAEHKVRERLAVVRRALELRAQRGPASASAQPARESA